MDLETIIIAAISASGAGGLATLLSLRLNKIKIQAEVRHLNITSDVSVAEISLKIIEEVKDRAKELKGDLEAYKAREEICVVEKETLRLERDHYKKESEECTCKPNNK
jgi:hypothetical protein